MAKKKVEKKPRRRLKRAARRSLAVVLMITAVVVAAIPVPENVAAPEDETTPGDPVQETLPYAYPASLTGTVSNSNLTKPDNPDPDPDNPDSDDSILLPGESFANIIQARTDGNYEMDWQFKFKQVSVNGRQRGIITAYNNSYAEQRVELKPNVTCDYVQFSQKQFDDYFGVDSTSGGSTSGGGSSASVLSYTCTNPASIDQEAADFFEAYFKTAFDAYKNGYEAAYREYEQNHERWLETVTADNPGGDFEEPKKPSFTRSISDLTLDDKYLYFCDHYRNGLYKGYKLALVIDAAHPGAGGTNTRIYIPQRLEKKKVGQMDDAQGFVYRTDASIIGIGDEAFKGTKNVYYLTVPDEIKYIGTSAFENSFLREITLVNTEQICDKAFKNCHDLTQVNMQAGVTQIGTECFYDTGVTAISFPSSMEMIGHGAFADCRSLQKVDFSKITGNVAVGDYAFYNTVALNEVNVLREGSQTVTASVIRIGEGAFAVEDGVTGNFTDFLFPTTIKQALSATGTGNINEEGLGDYALAGRMNLERVIMPSDFGRNPTPTAKVPDNTFYNCFNLEYVKFPADGTSCGYADFTSAKLFSSVSNPDFYVWGPELNARRGQATPRQRTWDAVTALDGVAVPYRYDRGEQQFYELCVSVDTDQYLMCIDNNGVLTSCTRKDSSVTMDHTIPLTIPNKVGEKEITAIGPGCFSDNELNQHVHTLIIEDDSKIASIAASVFKDWKELKKVYIGNSITEIGASAFQGCEKLVDVTFSSPLGGHESVKEFGENAFTTGSPELTFHGDIVKGYEPFKWAVNKDNVIKEPEGIRVCYKSLAPTFLTVMYDENTGLVTLLDYPKMSEISGLLNEAYATGIDANKAIMRKYGYSTYTYEHMREALSYEEFSSETFDNRRAEFERAWKTDGEAAYDSEWYGPWINPIYISDVDWNAEFVTASAAASDAGTAIIDFLFEPVTAYAAGAPAAYYTKHHFKVGESGSGYPSLNAEEQNLLDAIENIVVPDGVDSIDVYGYIGDRKDPHNRNANNADIYLNGVLDDDVWFMYSNRGRQDSEGSTATKPGLFSGYYDENLGADNGERYERGNDRIKSVTLNSVQYLPDYAFDSCENLERVILGPACKNIGVAPFRGCYEMEEVGDNEWYTTVNGIIYSKNTDDSLTIEECLAARGRTDKNVGPALINVSFDENLKKVSAIKPGAFENCVNLTEVNFGSNDTAGLTEIPDDCFKNCFNEETNVGLQRVTLPTTVNDIGKGVFVGDNGLISLTVYGDEVKISGSAFDSDKKVQTNVRAHEDSAVARYVKEYGSEYNLIMEDPPLGRQWQVAFYDANYQLIEDLVDDLGNPMDNPQYVEDGKTAVVPANPSMEGWTFENWVGLNDATLGGPIREDTIFYAQGHFEGGKPVNGNWVVEFFDGVDGQRIGGIGAEKDGTYLIPAGTSFADNEIAGPVHPVHAGFEPAGFTSGYATGSGNGAWTEQTKIDRNMTIIALYKASTTSGGSTNTSGGTTSSGTTSGGTTSGGTTSGRTTSNSSSKNSSSSSSSSSSSTSSSSTSSGSATSQAGMFTVFVENGSGSGSYAPGTTVIIQAAIPAAGMRFDKWTTESNGVSLASVSMSATTFTMPSNNVTVRANYVADTTPQAANTGGGSGGSTNNDTTDNGNTRVDIQKPGISNRDLATANVNGSTDNFVIKISETDEATRAVSAALTNKYGTLDNILYYAMDITLWDATGTYQLTGDQLNGISVDITIPIPDSLVAYGGNNMAGAVINGDQLENLNENFTTINGVPCIRFHATHFSPYTIYVDTGNLAAGMLDPTPQTGDPIHPKWFLSLGLACLSIILFVKKDKKKTVKVKA